MGTPELVSWTRCVVNRVNKKLSGDRQILADLKSFSIIGNAPRGRFNQDFPKIDRRYIAKPPQSISTAVGLLYNDFNVNKLASRFGLQHIPQLRNGAMNRS